VPADRPTERHSFPKVSVPLMGYKSKKQLIVIAAIVAAMLLTGAGWSSALGMQGRSDPMP